MLMHLNAFPFNGLFGCQWFSNLAMINCSNVSLNVWIFSSLTLEFLERTSVRNLMAERTSSFMFVVFRFISWQRFVWLWSFALKQSSVLASTQPDGTVKFQYQLRQGQNHFRSLRRSEFHNPSPFSDRAIYWKLATNIRVENTPSGKIFHAKNSNCVRPHQSQASLNNRYSLVTVVTKGGYLTQGCWKHTRFRVRNSYSYWAKILVANSAFCFEKTTF